MKIKTIAISTILLILFTLNSFSCTTAVISGKYTVDGKPLLWKHRDTWAVNNVMSYFDDGKYSYTGLVNSLDTVDYSIWIGMNNIGFAIMNSASYNLNVGDTIIQSGTEGILMKQALANCKNLSDFENFLDSLERPIKLEANFGVIDAEGGAAYYELGNRGYKKIDANDPKIAPHGYIIRSNYSFTGEMGIGGGYIRYQTASDLFYNAASTNTLSPEFILQKVSKGLYHSLIKQDLIKTHGSEPENNPQYAAFRDYIPRTGSASSVVIQGIKEGQTPDYTMLWSLVGFPLTSVVVPVWMVAENNFPDILKYDEDLKDSPICYAALTLKKDCFPIRWGISEKYYIDVNKLHNANKTGILQIVKPYEDEIIRKTKDLIFDIEENELSQSKIKKLNNWINKFISKMYADEFGISI